MGGDLRPAAGQEDGSRLDGGRNRAFVSGALCVLRPGARRSDFPERYGENWETVHKRFTRWAHGGVWERVFHHLSRTPDNEYHMIDNTIVRAHRSAASGKGGRRTRVWGIPEVD